MSPRLRRFDRYGIFDDKGEVKRLVKSIVQESDPDVIIERLRKMDFSYVFILFKKGKSIEVELARDEIEASWEWRKGNVDETLEKKIEGALGKL
jgi:hypothetical protein